jgi:hypothetical protein
MFGNVEDRITTCESKKVQRLARPIERLAKKEEREKNESDSTDSQAPVQRTSAAPLTKTLIVSPSCTTTLIFFRSDENGSAPTTLSLS